MDHKSSSKIKKIALPAVLAAVVVIYFLVTWLPWTGRTFSEGSAINGVDVSGLTISGAYEKLSEAAGDYTLTVTFFDGEKTLTASDLGLTVGNRSLVRKALQRQCRGQSSDGSDLQTIYLEKLYVVDADAVTETVSDWAELTAYQDQEAEDARLVYQEEEGTFVIEEEQPGGAVDADALSEQIALCVGTLEPQLDVLESGLYGDIRTSDDAEVQAALEKANAQLNLSIVYEYHVENDAGQVIEGTETIGRELLSQWLYVEDDGLTVEIDTDALQSYVTLMYDTYSVKDGSTSQFVTTNGDYVEVEVPAADETVDTDALYNDIIEAVDNLESGERDAPYASTSVGVSGTTDLGGSYVEIDLDSQHLWLYLDGTLIADGNICSGDVATGCATPGGLYTINSMETDRWLNGPTWHDWVSYWMPFNGSIGLHDATWRSEEEFGGDVYLESGSHGCINMPLELAKTVYENVDVGFYVILYGGEASEQNQPQTITGTSHYDKKVGDDPFYLDAEATGDGGLTYTSSNEKVVKVNEDGKVTIVGSGTATIQVVAPATERYTQATKEVTVTVTGTKKSEKKTSSGSQGTSSGSKQESQSGSQTEDKKEGSTSSESGTGTQDETSGDEASGGDSSGGTDTGETDSGSQSEGEGSDSSGDTSSETQPSDPSDTST